ncbi:HAD family hydrolase [Peredibacter starrii]|uniref:HAD family phosphatase n=1 Tax=Peredibacter starrii TaxID=28202 RepID=A0AAX4HLB0_9BACT|nr:HAD family phosphatase [Peredibacter starrii]WPU64049.1 HAD family phosphatase [Peredibacter starrii]
MKPSPITFPKVPSLFELKQGYPGLKALFFDMDGTLFNTEEYHAQAMFMIGERYKIRPPYSPETVHDLMMGKADHLVFDIIKDWEGVPKEWTAADFIHQKNANLIEILAKVDPAKYFPTAILSLLKEAKTEGIYLALVTSSEKVVTEELLKIAKVRDFFNLILTRDDCPSHKPDPWPYLKAMKESHFDKSEIIIFEDSNVGLEAAISSGAHVIKVGWY